MRKGKPGVISLGVWDCHLPDGTDYRIRFTSEQEKESFRSDAVALIVKHKGIQGLHPKMSMVLSRALDVLAINHGDASDYVKTMKKFGYKSSREKKICQSLTTDSLVI